MTDNIYKNLEIKGFHIFKNILSNESIRYGQNSFNETKVNYSRMCEFINNTILKTVNEKLKNKLRSTKYRVSNNNNSIDASALHRDVHNHYSKTAMPIYTCLTYLDKAIMELIPTSHNHTVINYGDLMKFYNSRIKIILNPGDILLINSAILHRGIYYKKMADNRRLIQLFDCMFLDDYKNLAKYIFHTQHKRDNLLLSTVMIQLSKIKPLINYINFTYYINTARGYGYDFNVIDKINENDYKFISLESNKRYKPKYDNSWEKGNVYIMNYSTNNVTPKQNTIIYFYMHIYTTIILSLSLLIIVFIIKHIIEFYRKKNKKNNYKIKRRKKNKLINKN